MPFLSPAVGIIRDSADVKQPMKLTQTINTYCASNCIKNNDKNQKFDDAGACLPVTS